MEISKKIEWNGKGSKSKPIIRDPLRFSSHSFSTHKCKFSFRKRLKQLTYPLFCKAVASTRKLHFFDRSTHSTWNLASFINYSIVFQNRLMVQWVALYKKGLIFFASTLIFELHYAFKFRKYCTIFFRLFSCRKWGLLITPIMLKMLFFKHECMVHQSYKM